MSFTHLHVHTEYSLLDGSCKIEELVHCAKELGMNSLAITDHGAMYGVIDFYRACRAEGINPVLGCEVYVAPGSRFEKSGGVSDERYYHLVLLAENDKGYSNLMKIVSRGFTEGFYYKPRVDYEILEKYHEGIIALSACLAGEVAVNLKKGLYEEASRVCIRLRDIFGENNFFLELQDHGIAEQKTVNHGLLRLARELSIPLAATNDVHYIKAEDAVPHDILLCIQTQKTVNDEERMRYEGAQFFLKSEAQMKELFPYALEALENTQKIADRCHVEIEFGKYKLPKFDVPEACTAFEYLKKQCEAGLLEKYENPSEDIKERLEYEMNTIKEMGFVDYFLIVADFIAFAKKKGISVGPGRGSAAGSIVAYCLGITDIDPIKFSLLFERFLNPERVTMPDIDIDFCYERRQEVIDYVSHKYGKDKVVQIVTFGTLSARSVIRDVGRALAMPYAKVDVVAKMIPNEIGITIEKALLSNNELAVLYDSDEEVRHLIDMSKRLEGLPRHTSMHAAGVVISNAPVDDYVPLSMGADNAVTTQFTMTTLEELGLLKMDFLGLRTLTVIKDASELVRRYNKDFDIEKIDFEDKEVYEMIGAGKTEGVFQLESTGMKNFMKELKPQNIEDIIAGIALYRPGPMDFIPRYIKGKNEAGDIKYECSELEPILSTTYGCIVYQEQVMQIVRELAGYSFGRSDLVRRAMSKKKADVMAKERRNFVYGNQEENVPGCIKRGISETTANKIFDEMTDFAKYAFNKAHATAYAVVSYRTAYLRRYYPVEFMAALMTSIMDNASKVSEYIYYSRKMGIKVLPPDINEGDSVFTVSDGAIRYSLSALKSVGRQVVDAVVAERSLNGPFTSLKDFISRLSGREVNKRTIESFIKSGAFDSLPGTRKQKTLVYEQIISDINKERKDAFDGQMGLFDFMCEEDKASLEIKFPDVGEFDGDELLAFEKEVLGVYVSGHPLEKDKLMLEKNVTATTLDFVIDDETDMPKVNDGELCVIGGMIAGKTVKNTRNNSMMAFITIEDLYGQVEVIVFPKDYEKYKTILMSDSKVLIRGRVTVEEERGAKLIASDIVSFEEVPGSLWLRFENKAAYDAGISAVQVKLAEYKGNNSVTILLNAEKQMMQLPIGYNVSLDDRLLEALKDMLGEDNVKVTAQKYFKKDSGR